MEKTKPSHVIVVMFTDIVGSVELKRQLGAPAYADLINAHDEIFSDIVGGYSGAEVHKDTGDGFIALFVATSQAVEAALRFQWELRKRVSGLRVCIGLHLGEAMRLPRAGQSKLVGLVADLAARVMGLALPGQILLTRGVYDDARQYVREHPDVSGDVPHLEWREYGAYLFKGMEQSLDVFEVGGVGVAPLAAPPDSEKASRDRRVEKQQNAASRRHLLIAIGVAVAALGGWYAWWSTRPAILHFPVVPKEAEIWIDSELVEIAPSNSCPVRAGTHSITIHHRTFDDYSQTVELRSGESLAIRMTFTAKEGHETEAFEVLSDLLVLKRVPVNVPNERSATATGTVLLFPRGRVRKADLKGYMADADAPAAMLVVRERGGALLHTAAINGVAPVVRGEFPPDLLDRLSVGKKYEWGLKGPFGERYAGFEVAPDLPPHQLEEIREHLGDKSPHMAQLLEITLLQREELHDAALGQALKLVSDWPNAMVYEAAWRSIEALGLKGSGLANQVIAGHAEAIAKQD